MNQNEIKFLSYESIYCLAIKFPQPQKHSFIRIMFVIIIISNCTIKDHRLVPRLLTNFDIARHGHRILLQSSRT